MFYNSLEQYLDKSSFWHIFNEQLISNNKTLFYGLNKSTKAIVLARAFKKTEKNIIAVSADDRLAEELYDDLALLCGKDNAHFLPDFEVLPYEERSPHYSIRAQRIETLAAAVSGNPGIYSLSLRAFLRYITPAKMLSKTILKLEAGKEYDLDVLVSNLVSAGYNTEYQVAKVGDFARRGGLIDVFSPNHYSPYRIEFFGDEIVSIREFHVSSQRSTGNDVAEITILPSREISIQNIEADEKLWNKVHNSGFYEGIEVDIPLLFKTTENFHEYFDRNESIIFFDEYQYVNTYIKEMEDETVELWEKAKKTGRILIPEPDKVFAGKSLVSKLFRNNKVFFICNSFQNFRAIQDKIESPYISQTNMHGDLSAFETNLNEKIEEDYTIFIQSDNKSQSKRMKELIPDLAHKIKFSLGVLHKGFIDQDTKLAVYTDHEIFSRYKKKKYQAKFSKNEALVDYESLNPGDYIVHINYGIGIYEGLVIQNIDGSEIECLSIAYAGGDKVYVPTYQLDLVSKYVSDEGFKPVIHKLGGKKWDQMKSRARKQIELVADDIVKLYAERKSRRGVAFEKDTVWQTEMEESFIYEDTPDQKRATNEIKADMESIVPMERLLCGDVGFGKTEVAIRAAFKAVVSGWQVVVLVPTTLLAEQHYYVFKERLAQYPVNIAMFSRFRSKANIDRDVVRIMKGEVDIAIGTHRLLSKDIQFNKLGLLIIDEEHRFGVRHKEKIRKIKSNVDTLYMSATPIPRTLGMALSKLKEISLIQTSPKARLPVRTIVVPYDEEVIKDAINREIDRGGQIFFLHNRVQTIDSVKRELRKLVPNASMEVAHGQMPEKQLESIMVAFSNHKFDVLIASTIIESGIDIPNANTIIINRADMFGLAQLYQLRGRVGRSNRRAYAYLVMPGKMNEQARKRLETLTEYDYLGAGYQIAMRDLELRGAGTMLGTKQSGVINSVGFNYYYKLLEQAVENMENNKPVWEEEKHEETVRVRIETDNYFPEEYIKSESVRLKMYKRLLGLSEPEQFNDLEKELHDRFGEIPGPAQETINFYRLRCFSAKAGMKSCKLKNEQFIIEYDLKNLPPRKNIGLLMSKFTYPVKFETMKSLKIIYTLPADKNSSKVSIVAKAIEILEFIGKWNGNEKN